MLAKWRFLVLALIGAIIGAQLTIAAGGIDVYGPLNKAQFEALSSDPTASAARFYYNSTSHLLKFYNGSAWRLIDNPMTATGDVAYSSDASGTPARLAIGGAHTLIHGGTTPGYSAVDLASADVTGLLPSANIVTSLASKTLVSSHVNTDLTFDGTSSGTMTMQPGSAITSYNLTVPAAQGNNGTVMTNNGSGVLTFSTAAGIAGSSGGATPAAGFIGESFSSGVTLGAATATYAGSTVYATSATMALTAGNWLVMASSGGYISAVGTSGIVGCDWRIYNSTDSTVIAFQNIVGSSSNPVVAGQANIFGLSAIGYLSISATKTVVAQIGAEASSGTPTNGACTTRGNGTMYAIRMP